MTTAAPADGLLWTLARGTLSAEARGDAARLMAAAPDSLADLARHGLVPLAYRHLVAVPGDHAGVRSARTDARADAVARDLATEFRRHATSRFRHARRLRDLLETLAAAGVEARPYKGPALAVQLYGNYAMRQYGDLDILVRPSQVEAAHRVLLGAGLQRRRPASEPWEEYHRRTRHSHALIDRRTGLLVELHWALADRFHGIDLDVAWLFEQPETIDLLGRPARVMGPERLLLALCVHGVKHLWERAAWIADVGELIRTRPRLDWAQVFEQADRRDFGRALRASLILVRDRIGVAPPEPWTARLEDDPVARRLAGAFAARVLAGAAAPDRLAERFRLGYLARTSLPRRVLFCWRVATHLSERDFRRLPRPPRFLALYGLRRSLRLVRRARAERPIVRT